MFERATAIGLISGGPRPCAACPGPLSDPALSECGWAFCRVSRCTWQVSAQDGHKYAATIPSDFHRPPPSPARSALADDRHR